ncbi:MAG: TldD/PmbA family protein [Planctomycetota bacterium]|jgi:predicted Zn-dependent protease
MNEANAKAILEKVLGNAKADAVTAVLGGVADASTRTADNVITQNVARNNVSLQVTCAYGESRGTAVTNDLGEASLKAVVERAQEIAKNSPPDPEYMPPVAADAAKKYPKVEAFRPRTLEYDPLAKAKDIRDAAAVAAARECRLSGAYSSGHSFRAFANSAGLRGYHRATSAKIHATVLSSSGSGWAEKVSNDTGEVDVKDVVRRATDIAVDSRNPVDPAVGKYTAILCPPAVSEIMTFLIFGGFDAKATDEGRTCLRGKLGKKICGDNITVRSDPSDPRIPGAPFQDSGLPSPTTHWIRGGVLENLFYSRFWAKKQGKEATGMPSNMIIEGGDTSVQEMIKSTKKGVLVTRFWYSRFVDPMVPLVTGMTRDGLFLIENGKVTTPLKHMRYNERLLEMLGRVEAMSPPERTGGWMAKLAPAMKVRGFNFTSTTKF